MLLFYPGKANASTYCKLQVEVQGLSPVARPLVSVSLSIEEAQKEKKLNEDRILGLHQIAAAEITAVLESLGYYHSKVHGELIRTDAGYFARYRVEMGPPTVINKVMVHITGEGSNNPELNALANLPPIKCGAQLTHHEYENYKQKLLSLALQQGYLDAVFEENEIRVNRAAINADIVLTLDTGKRYRFGDIYFQENPYPPEYLERYIPFQYGAPYTTADILCFQKALTETELFRYIRIDPILTEARDYAVPLNVRLKAKPRNRYTGSIGYGTDTGPRGTFWWEHRRFHYPGHRINAEIQTSKWKNYANLRYSIPGARPVTDRTVFGFNGTEEKFRDGKYSLRESLNANAIRKIGRTEQLIGLHYLISERYRELPGFHKKNAHYIIPNVGIVYTDVDRKSPLQEGVKFAFSLRGAWQPVLSTTSFIQAEFRGKWVYGFTNSARLLTRVELGGIATHRRDKISLSLRYFTGGDQTVRGYGYKSLGPRKTDAYGNQIVIGGQYLAVGSIELEHKIYKQFSGAVFYDAGQAMNKWKTRFAQSVGVGVRYKTPIGLLRVDVAQGLIPITQRKMKPRFHLTFGTDI